MSKWKIEQKRVRKDVQTFVPGRQSVQIQQPRVCRLRHGRKWFDRIHRISSRSLGPNRRGLEQASSLGLQDFRHKSKLRNRHQRNDQTARGRVRVERRQGEGLGRKLGAESSQENIQELR